MTTTESAYPRFVLNRTVDASGQGTRKTWTDLDRFATWIGPEGVEISTQ